MPITKWIHLDERGGDPWVLPVYSAINNASLEGGYGQLDGATKEIGLHISTKLNIIPRVISRMNENIKNLHEQIKQHEELHVFTKDQAGYAFPINGDLKYQLIADIETFLFQINATWDLIKKFIAQIYTHAGYTATEKNAIDIVKAIHERNNINTDWFPSLDRNRNFIAHRGAIYLAVDISNQDNWDLLAMMKNDIAFDKPKTFFTHSNLIEIYQGFSIAKPLIQSDLIELFS